MDRRPVAGYSIVTGVFGIQPQPTVLEGIVWVVYLIRMLVFVLWPQGRPRPAPAAATRRRQLGSRRRP